MDYNTELSKYLTTAWNTYKNQNQGADQNAWFAKNAASLKSYFDVLYQQKQAQQQAAAPPRPTGSAGPAPAPAPPQAPVQGPPAPAYDINQLTYMATASGNYKNPAAAAQQYAQTGAWPASDNIGGGPPAMNAPAQNTPQNPTQPTATDLQGINQAIQNIMNAEHVDRATAEKIFTGQIARPSDGQFQTAPATGLPSNLTPKPGLDWKTLDEQIRANQAREEQARQELAYQKGVSTGKVDGTNTMESVKYGNEILANPQNAALAEQIRKGYAIGDIPGQTVSSYLNRTVDNPGSTIPGSVAGDPLNFADLATKAREETARRYTQPEVSGTPTPSSNARPVPSQVTPPSAKLQGPTFDNEQGKADPYNQFGGKGLVEAMGVYVKSGGTAGDFVKKLNAIAQLDKMVQSGQINIAGLPPIPGQGRPSLLAMGPQVIKSMLDQYGSQVGLASGGAVIVGGEPHWIVDDAGNPVAALSEDGKKEQVKGTANGVEVIPLDPQRKAAYEARKEAPGKAQGGNLSLGQRAAQIQRDIQSRGPQQMMVNQRGRRVPMVGFGRVGIPPYSMKPPPNMGLPISKPPDSSHPGFKPEDRILPWVGIPQDEMVHRLASVSNALAVPGQASGGNFDIKGYDFTKGAPTFKGVPGTSKEATTFSDHVPAGYRSDNVIDNRGAGDVGAALQALAAKGLYSPDAVKNAGINTQGDLRAYTGERPNGNIISPRNGSTSALEQAINQFGQSDLAKGAMKLASYLEGGGGLSGTHGVGDSGKAFGPYQIRTDVHNISSQDAQDPYKATEYMSNSYNQAAERVMRENPGLWESNPSKAASLTAFYAERPAQMYDQAKADNFWKVINGATTGATIGIPSGELVTPIGVGAPPTLIASGGPRVIGNNVAGPRFGFNANAMSDIAGRNTQMGVKNTPGVFVKQAWKFAPRTLRTMTDADRSLLESYVRATGADPASFWNQAGAGEPMTATSTRQFL